VVLKPAEGDCWGCGLAFLDENNNSQIVLLDMEMNEDGDGSTIGCDAHYKFIQEVATMYKLSKNTTGSGLGDVIATGDFLYVCHSTTEGKSFEKEGASLVTLRADYVKRYYNALYGAFLAVKGEENRPKVYEYDLRLNPFFKNRK